MSHTSEFHGPIDGRIVIPGTHTAAGGTTNFHFSCPSAQSHPIKTHEAFSTVPFAPDPDFVHRPVIAAWVRDKCAGSGARAALVGLGGIGKSLLALQYAHSIRNAAPQTFVFWVHASTQARFEQAYRDIANRLKLPTRDDPKVNVLRLLCDWLRDETNGRWVMVVDNADNIETFFPSRNRQRDYAEASAQIPLATYLPQSPHGAILITSRSKDTAARLAGGYNKIKEVLAMDEDEGLQLLRNKLQDPPTEESAVDLLWALDCIPLAITQAAAYINRRARMSVASYLSEFRKSSKKRESLLNWDASELRRDESASNSVVTTWQMSFEQIQWERRSAAELLSLMCFFNPQGIPVSTLWRYSKDVADTTTPKDNEDIEDAFEEDLDTLQAYSLVSVTAGSDTCEMHALVQFCTRIWLSSFGNVEYWEQRFVALMAQELPHGEYENWAKCQQLFPHVEPLFDTEPASKEALIPWAQVLTNAGWYLRMRGRYSTAQQIATKAVVARERALGLDNQETLYSVELLVAVQVAQGKYEAAEEMQQRALEGLEKALGKEHPNTLNAISNLGETLRAQGKYEMARETSRRVIEAYEKVFGKEHPNTLNSINNQAMVLFAEGKYEAAEKMQQRALEGREKTLGKEHPDTLNSINNQAVVLAAQGKYEAAEKMQQRALEGLEKALGKEHPSTLGSMSNQAVLLCAQGKYEMARETSRRVVEAYEKVFGKEHPNTLKSISNQAMVLRAEGKYEAAEKMQQRALEGLEKALRKEHPDTLKSLRNQALVLHAQKKYEAAEKMQQRALEGLEKTLGKEHPDTLTSLKDQALVLYAQRKYEAAEKMQQRALEGLEKVFGKEHPSTLNAMGNLGEMLRIQKKYEIAEELQRQALEGLEKTLGKENSFTLSSMHCLALLLHDLGKYTEAAELYQRARDGYTRQLGPNHPTTIHCFSDFAALQQEAEQYELV